MSQAQADRNMLFGILAVQMGFINRDQLTSAVSAWVLDKSASIGEILQSQNSIDAAQYETLKSDMAKQLAAHGNDAGRALAAAGPPTPVLEALSQIIDIHVAASLGHASATIPDEYATRGAISADVVAPKFDESSATLADEFATRGVVTGPPGSAPQLPRPHRLSATVPGLPDSQSEFPSHFGGGASRFRVLRSHAKGGLGEVFVAKDEELNREVALKEIQNLHADHQESRTRFILEAEITGALEHPGIVPVYGLGSYQDGRPYYAMRFIRGDSLHDAITEFFAADKADRDPGERTIALRGLLRRFIDVCHAIAYAHSRGVIHRDIKPSNVMLGHFGETLVVDWGLAKPLGSAPDKLPKSVEGLVLPQSMASSTPTYIGLAVGTPQYMSPEQAAGKIDELGPATDVYSLGATLYCLLVGKAPFEGGADVGQMLVRVQNGEFRPPREVNPKVTQALDAICSKAMANKPEDRYATPKDLAEDVECWLADEPTKAWREPWIMRARRWANRHRTGVTSAVAALLVAGISLGIATILLTAANAREREARKEAQEQRDEAARNYQLARSAVDRYHTEVSEDVLLNEPGMEPLRHRLLEAAREFYAKFVAQHAGDPNVKAEFGRALYRLAQITADIESPRQGVELHKQALDVFASLASTSPEDVELMFDRASCLHHLGRIQRGLDDLAASRESYQSALELWGQLKEANQAESKYPAEEARTLNGLGNVEQVLRRTKRAREDYTNSLAIRKTLAEANPKRADYARDLATTRHNLAMVQASEGVAGPAEENYRSALAAQEKLARDAPNVTQYQADIARTHLNLANLLGQRGETVESLKEFQIAVECWRKLASEHPVVIRFQAGHAKALLQLCAAQRFAKDLPAAEESCKKAQEIYKRLGESGTLLPLDRAEVATGQRNMGNMYRSIHSYEQSQLLLEQSIELLKPLAQGKDPLPEYTAGLARSWNDLGFLLRVQRKNESAIVAFRHALGFWESLVAAHPENIDYAAGLAVTSRHLGELARGEGKVIAALDHFRRSIELLEAGAADRDSSVNVRNDLRLAYQQRAETFAEMERHSDAILDWERVFELSQGGDLVWARLNRAVALGRVKEHLRAASEADSLEPLTRSTRTGEALFKMGSAYALAAGGAEADPQLPSDQRKMLTDKYAEKALAQLNKAAELGFFKLPGNRERLEKSSDLNAIRGREGYAELLAK